MTGQKPIILLESNEKVRKALAAALASAGLDGRCAVEAGEEAALLVDGVRFEKPVRLGAVLDHVRRCAQSADSGPEIIKFGPFTLDRARHVLQQKGSGESVRLTEKEEQLLVLLYQAGGMTVERGQLLGAIWGYGEDIDTHTLETHIYRLRQKLEKDAAAPVYLLTADNGYSLKIK